MTQLVLTVEIDHMTSQELAGVIHGEKINDEELMEAIHEFGRFKGKAKLILVKIV
jgi:hypothetical protein